MVNIKIEECIIPKFDAVLDDMLNHYHSRYILPGGRGSTKSSLMGIAIPMIIMIYPDVHAACFRKVGNTVQRSIFAQLEWGINKLGVDHLFHIPKKYSSPIVYKPTGQQIFCMGLDDPAKVKSIKLPFGYIGITWFNLRTTLNLVNCWNSYWDNQQPSLLLAGRLRDYRKHSMKEILM